MPAFEMTWRDVMFASRPVDPAVVEPQLPDALALDTFEGDAYLSVVPFVIGNVRPRGLPAAVGLTTPELNLRTYVTHGGRPGVYFFSLDVDDLPSAVGARLFNHLPYYYADVDYEPGAAAPDGRRTRFESRRRTPGARACRFIATYGPVGDRYRPEPGSVEHFLVERYRYFAEGGDGAIHTAEIDHEPWRLRPAAWTVTENTLHAANGFDRPAAEPILSYSPGVDVTASASRRL